MNNVGLLFKYFESDSDIAGLPSVVFRLRVKKFNVLTVKYKKGEELYDCSSPF